MPLVLFVLLLKWNPAGVHDLAAGVWVKRRRRCMSIANAITNRISMNPVGVPYHVGVLPFAIEMPPAGVRGAAHAVGLVCRCLLGYIQPDRRMPTPP